MCVCVRACVRACVRGCVCVCVCVCVGDVLIRAEEGGRRDSNIFSKKVDGYTYFTYSGLKSSSFYGDNDIKSTLFHFEETFMIFPLKSFIRC